MPITLPGSRPEPVSAEQAYAEGKTLEGLKERDNATYPDVVASLTGDDDFKQAKLFLATKSFYDEQGAFIKKGQQVYRVVSKDDKIPNCLTEVEAPKATARTTDLPKEAFAKELGEDKPTRREAEESREKTLDEGRKAIEDADRKAGEKPGVNRAEAANPATRGVVPGKK